MVMCEVDEKIEIKEWDADEPTVCDADDCIGVPINCADKYVEIDCDGFIKWYCMFCGRNFLEKRQHDIEYELHQIEKQMDEMQKIIDEEM